MKGIAALIAIVFMGMTTAGIIAIGNLCGELRQTRAAVQKLTEQVERVGNHLEPWRTGP